MVKFIVGVLIIIGFLGLCYAPALWKHRQAMSVKHSLDKQLEALNHSGSWNSFVITEKLGEGGSQNSGDKFADTQKNRDMATESALWLMRRYMG